MEPENRLRALCYARCGHRGCSLAAAGEETAWRDRRRAGQCTLPPGDLQEGAEFRAVPWEQ